jgi:TPR repeat protein
MRRSWALLVSLAMTAACVSDLITVEAPKQAPQQNPLAARGQSSFEQRRRDCWEMPSAQACFDVGLNYEMGLVVAVDVTTALEFYDKACSLEKQDEHCQAAQRLRERANQPASQ